MRMYLDIDDNGIIQTANSKHSVVVQLLQPAVWPLNW